MAITNHHTIPARRGRIAGWPPSWPTLQFLRAATLGTFGVAVLAAQLPEVGLATTAVAVGFYALSAGVVAHFLERGFPHPSLGLCNLVTLVRLCLVAALVAPLMAGGGPSWAVFAVAFAALSLDGIDGWLARRQDRVSSFGARFDMEVDSALALILALNVAAGPAYGIAALLLGLPRYVFAAAGLRLAWMRKALPDRFSRKAVCVLQIGALIALQAPLLPPVVGNLTVPLVAAALVWSFGADVLWLWRRRA